MSLNRVQESKPNSVGLAHAESKNEPDLHQIALDESEDADILNEDYDDITEIESNHVEENLDNLQALISDTRSEFLASYLTLRCQAGYSEAGEL